MKTRAKEKNDADLTTYIQGFGKHIGSALESIQSAANLYAEAIRKYEQKAQDAFEAQYPHVSPATWTKLRLVGNGDLNPAAMLLSNKFCAQIGRMPRHKQDEVLNGDSFDVFNPTTREVERVNYGDLKPRHERIIFDEARTTIRTIPQQVAYADAMAAEKKAAARNYTVHTDHLEVHCACVIGKSELEHIVEDMA